MWIEVLLLAKLSRGPLHGYELRKEVEASTGRTLSNNSLYPTLRRFVDAVAKRSGGRVFSPDVEELGRYVVDDYVRSRRGKR